MTSATFQNSDQTRTIQSPAAIAQLIQRVAEQAGINVEASINSITTTTGVDPGIIAEHNQIPVYHCDLPEQWWKRSLGPFIGTVLQFDSEQFVAVLPSESGGYLIIEEGGQVQTIRNASEAQALSNKAWFLSPIIDISMNNGLSSNETLGKELQLEASVRSLFMMAKRHWFKNLSLIVAGLAISIFLSFATPIVLSQIIDRALPLADQTFAVSCIALLVMFNLSQSLLVFMRNMLVANTLASMTLPLQAAVIWRILQSPLAFFRGKSPGDLTHRSVLISNVSWQVGTVLFESLFTGIVTVSSIFVAIWISPQLFAIAFPVALIEAALYFVLVRKIRDYAIQLETARSRLLGRVVRWLKSISLVKSCGIEAVAARDLGKIQHSTIVDQSRLQRLEDIRKLIGTLGPAIGFIIVLSAAYQWTLNIDGALSIGSIAGFIAAYRAFSTGLSGLATGLAEVVSVRSQLLLMRPLLEQSVESFKGATRLGQFSGQLEFSNVTFTYQDSAIGIRNCSFTIEPGEFVGVLGRSGSGKSTLLRLILGLENPQAGTIRVDGCLSKSLDWHCIRKQIGSVLQSARLTHGTIRENIIHGRSYSEAHIWKVLDIVEMSEPLERLPLKLETIVAQSGSNLSGGQCQRILLARALAASPSMLVLDEAMSGLDEGQQSRILKRLKLLGITIVLVSHRPSSFLEADRILSIENGLVAESQSGLVGSRLA